MPQAKLILKLDGDPDKLQVVGVYEVYPPIDGNSLVVVSSVDLKHYIKKTLGTVDYLSAKLSELQKSQEDTQRKIAETTKLLEALKQE